MSFPSQPLNDSVAEAVASVPYSEATLPSVGAGRRYVSISLGPGSSRLCRGEAADRAAGTLSGSRTPAPCSVAGARLTVVHAPLSLGSRLSLSRGRGRGSLTPASANQAWEVSTNASTSAQEERPPRWSGEGTLVGRARAGLLRGLLGGRGAKRGGGSHLAVCRASIALGRLPWRLAWRGCASPAPLRRERTESVGCGLYARPAGPFGSSGRGHR